MFYGSQTGTAEEFSNRLAKDAHRYGMKGMAADPEEYEMVMYMMSLSVLDLFIALHKHYFIFGMKIVFIFNKLFFPFPICVCVHTLLNKGDLTWHFYSQGELSRLAEIENSLAIFCMATYGEGDPTDNAQDFYDWLQEGDADLHGVKYTVSSSSHQFQDFRNKNSDFLLSGSVYQLKALSFLA